MRRANIKIRVAVVGAGWIAQTVHLPFLADSPEVELVAIADSQVEPVIEAITGAASTGKIGDGKIFISPIEQAVRIRTGESGEEAL